MAVKAPPQVTDGNMKCEEAGQALGYAIAGLLCFFGYIGIIFAATAISKAVQARRLIREDPRLVGEAKANVALILGTMVCILWVIAIFGRVKRGSRF
jgi:Trk-type K+ transport system membrane component